MIYRTDYLQWKHLNCGNFQSSCAMLTPIIEERTASFASRRVLVANGHKLSRNTTWWRHQMETFSASLALCAGNSPVTGEFPSQRPVTRSFDAFFDLRLNKRLSKQSWGWWFETPSCSLWRNCNEALYSWRRQRLIGIGVPIVMYLRQTVLGL